MMRPEGRHRAVYAQIQKWLDQAPRELLAARRAQAEMMFRRIGITFAVYGDKEASERLIPFDLIPRMIARSEWTKLEAGLVQRVRALNMFLSDIYNKQEILKAGTIPADIVLTNPHFRPLMRGWHVPHDIYIQIAGIDIVRLDASDFYVLEDNVRTPSGVSYMLENREVMMRLLPELYAQHQVAPVETYTDSLLASLRSIVPHQSGHNANIVVLTPGQY
ncbi:MAG: circularly permuted type 2 ATP-grasp protein, partial [Alphaproteobacteria bacterium]|nr:circularly permuted type 2 ATP-grasp protein [Alphaproteobacteria bacterium]